MVLRRSVCRPSSTIPMIYFKTAWQIKVKFYVEPLCIEGTKVCSRHPGHMTKMATTFIYKPNDEKTTICICENKDADQLRGNREADQRLCFRYKDNTIHLLSKSDTSSL